MTENASAPVVQPTTPPEQGSILDTTTTTTPPASPEGAGKPPEANAQTAAGADPWEGDDWKKLVPDKFKDETGELKLKEIAKSYANLEKRLGAGDAPPKTPDEYKLDYKLPEGVAINKENEKGFLAACHAQGMTNKQVQFVMDKYAGLIGDQVKNTDTKPKAEAELKKAWGEQFGEKVTLAQKAFKALPQDEVNVKSLAKIANNPGFVSLLAYIGKGLKEDVPPVVNGGNRGGDDEIQAAMRSEPYWNAKHPEHLSVKARVEAYHKAKFTKKSA